MKLEMNGKQSSGKRTCHFDIKFFYITDLIQRKEIKIEYCPTDELLGDHMTKPLTGSKFLVFRKLTMNLRWSPFRDFKDRGTQPWNSGAARNASLDSAKLVVHFPHAKQPPHFLRDQ